MTLTRRPVQFRLHIDHLGNPQRDVWAVSWRGHYITTERVLAIVPLATVFRGAASRQPRAYLTGRGRISRAGRVVTISR